MAVGSNPADNGVARLSAREVEVLEMTSLGMTNGQVAARLHVTVHAVKFHLASVYRKLGVTNRTQAASVYLRASHSASGAAPTSGSPD
jgi:DNA-binding CsgD family transcriptional regulator